jgi:hypothetical protein
MLIIGIHGVGNPHEGEIRGSLERVLIECKVGAQVREINWNQIVSFPVLDGTVKGDAVRTLAKRLARASHWEWMDPSLQRSDHAGLIEIVRELGYAGSEISIVALFATVAWALPIIVILDLLQRSYAPSLVRTTLPFTLLAQALILIASIILFGGSGLAAAISTGRFSPIFVTSRRILCLLFRPIVLAIYAVFVVKWWKLSEALLAIFLPPILFGNLVLILHHRWSVILVECLAFLATWLMTHHVSRTASRGAGSFLKILLDIFQYVSDPDYRRRIQLFVDRMMDQIGRGCPSTEIVIVAHSLGSVIAVDSLLHSNKWIDKRITLVTVGSPLRRFFFNLFPGLYFPPSADGCSKELAGRIKNFRWLNSYRRLDYIGKAIGLTPNSWQSELPTKQWTRWHMGYFGDGDAAAKIVEALDTLDYSDQQRVDSGEFASLPIYRAPQHRDWINKVARRLMYGLILLLPCSAMWNIVVHGRMQKYHVFQQRLAETRKENQTTIANVTYYSELMGASGYYDYVYHWDFRYKDGLNIPRRQKIAIVGAPFADFLNEDYWHFGKDPIPEAERLRCETQCTFILPILVDSKDPTYFVVPGSLPSFSAWSQLITVLYHEFIAVLLVIVLCVLLGIYVAPAFQALVGERNSEAGPRMWWR